MRRTTALRHHDTAHPVQSSPPASSNFHHVIASDPCGQHVLGRFARFSSIEPYARYASGTVRNRPNVYPFVVSTNFNDKLSDRRPDPASSPEEVVMAGRRSCVRGGCPTAGAVRRVPSLPSMGQRRPKRVSTGPADVFPTRHCSLRQALHHDAMTAIRDRSNFPDSSLCASRHRRRPVYDAIRLGFARLHATILRADDFIFIGDCVNARSCAWHVLNDVRLGNAGDFSRAYYWVPSCEPPPVRLVRAANRCRVPHHRWQIKLLKIIVVFQL